MKSIRVLVADDHTMIRSGLRALLDRESDIEVVGEAADGRQAVQKAQELLPHVVLLDIAMPFLNGIEAARQIASKHEQQSAIIILSMHSDESYVLEGAESRCARLPAEGFGRERRRQRGAGRHRGKAYFSPAISQMLAEDYLRQMQQRGAKTATSCSRRANGRCCSYSPKGGPAKTPPDC